MTETEHDPWRDSVLGRAEAAAGRALNSTFNGSIRDLIEDTEAGRLEWVLTETECAPERFGCDTPDGRSWMLAFYPGRGGIKLSRWRGNGNILSVTEAECGATTAGLLADLYRVVTS